MRPFLRLLPATLVALASAGPRPPSTPAAQEAAAPGEHDQERDPTAGNRSPQEVPDEELIVREVVLDGLESYDRAGVLRTLGIEVGRPLPALRLGIQRVWETYRILVVEPDFQPLPGGGLSVRLRLEELPVDLDPRFVGNRKVDEETLLEWAMLFDREEIYVHEAEGVRSRLLDGYRRRGYHFAEIDVVVGGGEGAASDIIFEIREGPRVRCTGLVVRGNESLPDTGYLFWRGGLRKLADVQTKGRGIFRWWGGVFDREVLDADLAAMRAVYRDRGWLEARVEIEDLEFNEAGDRVRVHLLVDEGPLWRVGSLAIEAVGAEDRATTEELLYPLEELMELVELRPGVPYETARLQNDRFDITRYYGERGHAARSLFRGRPQQAFEWLEPDVVVDVERQVVAVTYRIVQGRPRTVREVLVTGNSHTNDRVVRRAASILPGAVADIQQVQRSLARIRGTGYFDDVQDPSHPPPTVTFREVDGRPDLVDVEFEVEEGRVVDFSVSGGVNSDRGAVGLIALNMRNFQASDLPSSVWSTFGEIYRKEAFHGNGETFGVTLSPGTEVNYWKIGYAHPDIFGTHFDRFAAQVELVARDRRYRSHDEDRTTGTLTIARLFAQGDFSVRFGPKWMSVDLNDLSDDDDLPSTLVASEGGSDFAGMTLDLRLSKLDNRWNPREGYFAEWSNTIYGGAFGGDNDVWLSELAYDWYFQLGDPEDDIRSGMYLGLAGGFAHTYGDTDLVNYAERFFLGGSSTLRGFDFRGVGPNEGDFSLGGETYLRGTLEYRRPIYSTPIPGTSRRQEVFRGILFLDAGILDPDGFELDADELRASTGIGFGLTQPIPLVFSFGFPIEEGDGDDTEVFSFRITLR